MKTIFANAQFYVRGVAAGWVVLGHRLATALHRVSLRAARRKAA